MARGVTKLGYLIAQQLGEDTMGRIFYNALTEGLYSQSDFKHLGQVLLTKTATTQEKQAAAKDGRVKSNDLIDALSIGVFAAKRDSPVLIVSRTLDSTQKLALSTKKPSKVTKVGGNGNESAFEELKSIF
ncbi:cell wall-binding repeat-containing protein [Romboutsia sp.]|uniref:cell wall-binding repeat-containing protein n=1 Tax=Romboutsia sp. TaxID=1965302 RepID=UPI003F3E6C05